MNSAAHCLLAMYVFVALIQMVGSERHVNAVAEEIAKMDEEGKFAEKEKRAKRFGSKESSAQPLEVTLINPPQFSAHYWCGFIRISKSLQAITSCSILQVGRMRLLSRK